MARAERKTKRGDLTGAMDGFALDLLEKAKVSEGLADKIAAFAQIGKWIAIRHRLDDGEDREGELLAGLKARMRADSSGPSHLTTAHQRMAALRRWGKSDASSAGDNGGPALEALRGKLGIKGSSKPLAE
jgi:hypothetical protein